MPLAPTNTRGLWCDPTLAGKGAHAVVIGISDYTHLDGTSAVGGLGKLVVSAKTAATIFYWLHNRGAVAGQPLASCRLLLAPVTGEMADLRGLSYGQPCYANIREALEGWRDDLFASAGAGRPPVAFFFFSGHGIEHLSRPSLLAQDILAQGMADPGGKAVALNSLLDSVRTYGVKHGLFFIDACRNAPDIAKRLNIVGKETLAPDPSAVSGPEALVWLQATRMGDFAFQAPSDSASLFGRALIEALEGLPPDHSPYNRGSQPWRLIFGELERFVKRRTQDLLSQRSATQIQVVVAAGNPYDGDLVVAEKKPPARMRTIDAAPLGFSFFLSKIGDDYSGVMPRRREPSSSQRADAMQQRFTKATLRPSAVKLDDYDTMHEILGSETIANLWVRSVKVLDLDTGRPAGKEVRVYGGQHQVKSGQRTVWLDLLVEPGAGKAVWIQLGGLARDQGFAVAIPCDQNIATPVRLDLSFSQSKGLTTLSARFGSFDFAVPSNDGMANIWSSLWEIQREELLGTLGESSRLAVQSHVLEETLQGKARSPVAASITASLLLRAGALAELHDWPRNLADRFPWLADGPVLWAETLHKRNQSGPKALEYFLTIAERGPPMLGPVLRMAAQQAEIWKRVGSVYDQDRFQRTCEIIETAMECAVPESLFLAFIARDIVSVRESIASTRSSGAAIAG